MSYPAYDSYKDSGVEWLGDVPSGWDVERLKINSTVLSSNVDKKTIEGELPVRLCNYTDVYYHDKIFDNIDFMKASAKPEEIAKFSLRNGDVIITKDSETPDDIGVPAIIAEEFPSLVCGYHLAILRGQANEMFGSYLFYAIKSELSSSQFAVMANGVTRFGLSYDAIKNLLILKPSLIEQKSIAAFLDEKTAAIDGLIAKKEKLLELLAEKRTALITQAVTKGLDLTAPMKPSGINWLGDVPKEWEVWKMSHGFNLIGSGTTPNSANALFYEGETPWITTSELREKEILTSKKHVTALAISTHTALKIYKPGSLVFAMYGATIGRLAILGIEATVNQACCVFDKPVAFSTKFIFWWLQMAKPILLVMATGGGQPNLSQEDLKYIRVPAPSIEEQTTIALHLDEKTNKIDGIMETVESAIAKLKEYRAALITNAVTGKIKVV